MTSFPPLVWLQLNIIQAVCLISPYDASIIPRKKKRSLFKLYSKTKPKILNFSKTNRKSLSPFFFSDPPSFLDLKNQTKEIVEGVKMSLQCNVTAANPEPNITWYSATGNDTVLSDAVRLTFFNISRSNSGNYFCVAENGIGPKLTSGLITLNVQRKFIDFLLKDICNDKNKPFCYS